MVFKGLVIVRTEYIHKVKELKPEENKTQYQSDLTDILKIWYVRKNLILSRHSTNAISAVC